MKKLIVFFLLAISVSSIACAQARGLVRTAGKAGKANVSRRVIPAAQQTARQAAAQSRAKSSGLAIKGATKQAIIKDDQSVLLTGSKSHITDGSHLVARTLEEQLKSLTELPNTAKVVSTDIRKLFSSAPLPSDRGFILEIHNDAPSVTPIIDIQKAEKAAKRREDLRQRIIRKGHKINPVKTKGSIKTTLFGYIFKLENYGTDYTRYAA